MKTKMLGILTIFLGVFLFAGVAAASDADTLQPASTITYNDNLDVNGTLYANSAYIGEPGIGGVTFFNGTIINLGADPVTFGDDVRIDGEIFRAQKGGDPLKISDSVIPTLTNANDLGSASNVWRKLYVKDADFSGSVDFTGASVTGLTNYFTKSESDSRYYVNKTQTRYLSINGSEFIPRNNTSAYEILNNGAIYTSSGTPALVAPINLPHGAVITEFKVYYFDDDVDNFNVYLSRSDNAGASLTLAAVDTGGTSDASSKASTSIYQGEVDNINYSYLVRADSFKAANTGEQQLYSIRIKYRISSPLP